MPHLYYRAIVQNDVARPAHAPGLGGGAAWFTHVEVLSRSAAPEIVAAADLPQQVHDKLTRGRFIGADGPQIMGIVNCTPDSFSDGGLHAAAEDAIAGGLAMVDAGAHILDIGGESTRPGAITVEAAQEVDRVVPVIEGLRASGFTGVISIDTRKADVARAACAAGATLINDISGFTYDPEMTPTAAKADVPVCVMHGPVDPATMQNDPQYEDVILDVYDFLEARLAHLQGQGIDPDHIIVDPGIGFGKTQADNLALLARLSLFHSLGVPVLLGASRKKFIGTIGQAPQAAERAPGSIAVALAGIAQGVQIVRVHDVAQTKQAIALWRASVAGY